jgi:hypothetical protein
MKRSSEPVSRLLTGEHGIRLSRDRRITDKD